MRAGIENTLNHNSQARDFRAIAFVAREEVRGIATGQYNFSPQVQLQYIDQNHIILDHTPLLGLTGDMAYQRHDYKFTVDAPYSNGLRGGSANSEQLPVAWQINPGAVRNFKLPYIGELENRAVLIKSSIVPT